METIAQFCWFSATRSIFEQLEQIKLLLNKADVYSRRK